jgi:hypothetical protein
LTFEVVAPSIYISEMAEDEALLRCSASFEVIAHPDAVDIDRLGPPIVEATLSLK